MKKTQTKKAKLERNKKDNEVKVTLLVVTHKGPVSVNKELTSLLKKRGVYSVRKVTYSNVTAIENEVGCEHVGCELCERKRKI